MRLLIAEDDAKLLKSLVHIFEGAKYTVDGVTNGTDALNYAMSGEYDGLVLDIMMPGMDGVTVLRTLREKHIATPALFLTARTEVYQRIEGLDAGADDYLPKPFFTQELLARVRAMLRRRENYTPDLLRYGDMTLNRSTYELEYGGRTAPLGAKEFGILEMLMENPKTVMTIDRILSHVWNFNSEADISVVWVHISNIRKKIAAIGAPYELRFVRQAGYMLEGAV